MKSKKELILIFKYTVSRILKPNKKRILTIKYTPGRIDEYELARLMYYHVFMNSYDFQNGFWYFSFC